MRQIFTKICFVVLLSLCGITVKAEETFYQWTGSVSTDWNVADNWSPSGIPDINSHVRIVNEGVLNWPTLTTDVLIGPTYFGPGTQIDTKGKKITTGDLFISGATINNTTPDTDIRFDMRQTAGIDNSTFNGNSIFAYDCATPLPWGGFEEGVNGPNHFVGNTTFLVKEVGGLFSVCAKFKSIFDGDVDVQVSSQDNFAYSIFKAGATVNGDFSLFSTAAKVTANIGNPTVNSSISGKVIINSSDRFLTVSNLINLTSGGEINTNNFSLKLNSNTFKVTNVKSITERGEFINNVIDANLSYDMFASGVNFTFLNNKVTGTADFKIHFKGAFGNQWSFLDKQNEYLEDVNYHFLKLSSTEKLQFDWNGSSYAKNITFTDSASVELMIQAESLVLFDYNNFVFKGAGISQIYNNGTGPTLLIPNLAIEKTGRGKLILSTPLSVSKALSFVNGYIESSTTNPLILLDGATVSGASNASHVIGSVNKVGKDAFIFPIGSGTKFTPVGISSPGNVTDEFSALYAASSPSDDGYNTESRAISLSTIYNLGYWDIKRLVGSSNVFVSLGYNVRTGYITDQSKLSVAHWNGSEWEDLGNGGTDGSLTIGTVSTASQVADFSPFTIASTDASNPLPVKLATFSVHRENETAMLEWSTTEELDSDYFEIEHSQNAFNWQKVGRVKAMGESETRLRYTYSHDSPHRGLNYYRLKMIDVDGSFTYSKVLNLEFFGEQKTVIYPNPIIDGKLFIETASGGAAAYVEVTNLLGQRVLATDGSDVKSGINLSKLPSGAYLVKIRLSNGQNETQKVVVRR